MRRYISVLLAALLPLVVLLAGQGGATGASASDQEASGWLVDADGIIQAVGGAAQIGDLGQFELNSLVVGIESSYSGAGYWLAAADGGVFAFGDAGFFGSMGGVSLVSPVVAMASTATGEGYWLVAADGGVFAFGDAGFFGSMGGAQLNSPVVAMASTGTGQGYWLVAADGGVFAFGDAGFFGSMGQVILNSPVVDIASAPDGEGYWMVGADGGIFNFGTSEYYGSRTFDGIVASDLVPASLGDGYQIISVDGSIVGYGSAPSSLAQSSLGTVVSYAPSRHGESTQPLVTTTAPSTETATTAPSTETTTTGPTTETATTGPTTTTVGNTSMTYPSAGSTPQERAYNALGIYKAGADAVNFVNHEKWMGRKTNYWLTWLSGDFDSTLSTIRSGLNSSDSKYFQDERTLILSMNLTARDGHYEDEDATQQLTDAKNGVNDWYWEELGRLMVEKGMTGYWPDGRPKVILRIAWEHNGDWYPWSARPGRNELFRDAYRRAVLTLESTAGDVTTVWGSSTLNNTAADLNASYPGDDVVDIIEVDVYDAYGAYVPNPLGEEPNIAKRETTWLRKLNGTDGGLTGLQFFVDFAEDHKKGFAIGEFGVFQQVKDGQEVGGGDNPEWIQHIFDFAGAQENLVYVNYFEVNRSGSKHRLSPTGYSDGIGGVSGSLFPIAAAKFLELWGSN